DGQAAARRDLQVHVMKHGYAVVREIEVAELDFSLDRLRVDEVGSHSSIGNLGLGHQDFVDSAHGSRAALEDVDDPAQANDRPGQHDDVSVEGDEVAEAHAMEQNFTAANPQHDHYREPEQQLQSRPEHAGQSGQGQTARHVFLVAPFKQGDLRVFLGVRTDHARAGEVFLGASRDLRKLRLDLFKTLMDLEAKILHDDAGQGQRREGIKGETGADLPHEDQGHGGKNQRVRRVHDRRPQQHADGVQVIGGTGHDVAGAVLLVVGIRERLQMTKNIIAQVVFN